MSILLALALAAPGVSYSAPPMHRGPHRGQIVIGHGGGFNRYPGYRFIGRGGFVPSYWAHPGFTIAQPWFYGFAPPAAGRRWIRYYDDALLVDRHGRVHDGRYRHDWSRHRDRWGRDRRGIPIYVGDGDFFPDDRDYAWVERFERGDDGMLAYDRDYPYDAPYGGEGVSQGYAYGCGPGCGGYTVTETIVTTPTTYREVTTYEDVVSTERVRTYRPARRHRSKTLRR